MEVRHEQPAATGRNEPWPYDDFWRKQGSVNLLSTSASRGWSGLPAQLCTTVHKGVIPWRTPSGGEVGSKMH